MTDLTTEKITKKGTTGAAPRVCKNMHTATEINGELTNVSKIDTATKTNKTHAHYTSGLPRIYLLTRKLLSAYGHQESQASEIILQKEEYKGYLSKNACNLITNKRQVVKTAESEYTKNITNKEKFNPILEAYYYIINQTI